MRAPPSSSTATVEMRVEVPRGGFVKRDEYGRLEFLSPLPCPFNYGSVPAHLAPDGDALDAVLLGPRRAAGQTLEVPVQALVRFIDDGQQDDKLICAAAPLSGAQRALVLGFFHFYALCKRLHMLGRARRGATLCLGWGDAAEALGARPSH